MQPFRFQRFCVLQQASAMRVCTDATLFGAMAPIAPGDRVLDIGTGTGLLALMAAQLGAAEVLGVELTREAWREAQQNFRNSPWSQRLRALHADIRLCPQARPASFDVVISNPPFFHQHTPAANDLRHTARHADSLSHRELLQHACARLRPQGLLYLLLPSPAVAGCIDQAAALGLALAYRTDIRGLAHKPPKVSALTFGFGPLPSGFRLLTLYQTERVYTAESAHYLADFLLRFATRPESD